MLWGIGLIHCFLNFLLKIMVPLIEFDHVTITVKDKTLLADISFSLFTGEKAVFCGKSGSGKSTVLKALLGLHNIKQGQILFNGQLLNPQTIKKIRHDAVYISQEPILAAATVQEALLLPFQFKAHQPHKPTRQRLIEILSRLDLSAHLLEQETKRISGGEKQRVALARGLLMGKTLYLLDEVTSALDSESKQAVYAVCFQAQSTLLSVAHDPEWLARCDSVYNLEQGRLIGTQHDYA